MNHLINIWKIIILERQIYMENSIKLLNHLENVASILPMPIYWMNASGLILGCNDSALEIFGITEKNELIGKLIHELYLQEIMQYVDQFNKQVFIAERVIFSDEVIKNITTGEIKYFTAIKSPLKATKDEIIGSISILIDVTHEKRKTEHLEKRVKLLEDLSKIASLIPTPIYWEDVNSVIMGANKSVIDEIGLQSLQDYVGKSLYELYPRDMAEHIKKHNEEVMRTGKIMSQEEKIRDKFGNIKYYAAVKAPLRDDEGNIIGVVGASVDITKQKELENFKLQEQEKFTKIANQVAHDIRSPLASLLMIVKSCTQIPETDRIALREAALGIGDIANHLLSHYQKKESDYAIGPEESKPVLVSAILFQILAEKKYQYQKLPVKFDCHFNEDTHFVFIKVGPSSFKRMLSNLINNAVDAFDDNPGKVNLCVESDQAWVRILIQDNGKGMSKEIADKIINKIAVTASKASGHGIGLTQVSETLEKNRGELSISSQPTKGTTITVQFPRIHSPSWIAEEIALGSNDIIIILDDDTSIHGAWRTRFEPILLQAPNVQLKHFQIGEEALVFIENLTANEKERVLLLTDYELLKQEFNGLHVVMKSQVKRSVLVTSHYSDPLIQEQAGKTKTKILPKQLASEIKINIHEIVACKEEENIKQQADVVIVDDDKGFADALAAFAFCNKQVDRYYNPEHFLQNISKYSKETKILLDNNYQNSKLMGWNIAQQLHELGYTSLYLLSGEVFDQDNMPTYLTVIRKDDIDRIQKL
jgi:PAS domain S-box-containing protein